MPYKPIVLGTGLVVKILKSLITYLACKAIIWDREL